MRISGRYVKSPELAKAFQVVPNDLKIRALGLASGMYYTTKPDSIGIFLPSYIYGKHWKKSSFYPYINPENKEIIRNRHRHFWSQLMEILFEIIADSMQKR